MSVLIYNGVQFAYGRTKAYSFHSERDPSHTDTIWNTYDVVFDGVPLDGNGNMIMPSASLIAQIQHILNIPRMPILYQMNDGITLFQTAGIDAGMGPEIVSPAVIHEVTSGGILVETHYKVRLRDCVTGNPDPIVSLRWAAQESFNDVWASRISIDGRLIVRSDLLQSADNFRSDATPPILTDYVRLESRYRLSEDATQLQFNFVDEERDRLPPYPAVKATGSFLINAIKGAKRTGHAEVTLTGQKGTSRKELMIQGIRMCLSKLKAEGITFHTQGTFKEDLFEPIVMVSMQGMLANIPGPIGSGGAGGAIGAGLALAVGGGGGLGLIGTAVNGGVAPPTVFPSVGNPPDGVKDDRNGIAPPIRKRLLGLLAAAFRDPCAAAEIELIGVPGGTDAELRTTPGAKSTAELKAGTFSLSVGPLPPVASAAAVSDSAPYTHYHCDQTFTYSTGQAQLPGTGVGNSGGVSSVVTVHGGMMQLTVSWAAVRAGTPPVLPTMNSPDQNLVLLDAAITTSGIDLEADAANPTYAAGGYYLYAVLDPSKVSITAAILPFLSSAVKLAGQAVASAYSDSILWGFVGSTQPNPFISGQSAVGQPPNNQIANQLGAGLALIGSTTADQSAPGGLGQTGSSGQGGYLAYPPVNP